MTSYSDASLKKPRNRSTNKLQKQKSDDLSY